MNNVATGRRCHRFAVDRNLGKLGKWLRLAGFDTLGEPSRPMDETYWERIDSDRHLLVRSRHLMVLLAAKAPLLILSNNPADQLRQVICTFELEFDDLRPFTRCTLCNLTLKGVKREKIYRRVPDYVWHSQDEFRQCSQCLRIYWPGSHKNRSMIRIQEIWREAGL